jgi:hypothetical protein
MYKYIYVFRMSDDDDETNNITALSIGDSLLCSNSLHSRSEVLLCSIEQLISIKVLL